MSQSRNTPRSFFGIRIPSFAEGSFAWNLSFNSGTNLIYLVAQFIFTPLIVKLYSPEAYGASGAIFALSALFLSFATLQYDKAMFLPKDMAEVRQLRNISVAIPVYFAVAFTLVLLFWRDGVLRLASIEAVGNGIYLVPLLLVVTVWAQATQRMGAVHYRYKQNFIYNSSIVVGSKLVALGYGLFINNQYLGLTLSELFNKLALQILSAKLILKEKLFADIDLFHPKRMLPVMRKYIGFPKFELPATGLAALANQVPLFWIPRFFSLAEFGQYSLAISLLEMPMRLIGYSISGTYYQKAAATYHERGAVAVANITYRMMALTALVSVVPLLVIVFTAEPLFSWFFGAEWAFAGTLTASMSVFYFARLIAEPVSSVLRVINEQRSYVWLHGLFLVLRAAVVGFAIFMKFDLQVAMWWYASVNALGYGFQAAFIIARLRKHARLAPPLA